MGNDIDSEPARHAKLETVFFSHHFEEDQALVLAVTNCLERHGLQIVTGKRLGGVDVPSAVKDRIRSAHSVIALMTRRYKIGEPGMDLWDTYPWVRDELSYGYQLEKPAIAIVEIGVEVAGAFSSYERITFSREHWDSAIEALKQTLLLWTGKLGAKPIEVHLEPAQDLRNLLLSEPERVWCRYRWWLPPAVPEEWVGADIQYDLGSPYFLSPHPTEPNALIQVEVLKDGEPQWSSAVREPEIRVELKRHKK